MGVGADRIQKRQEIVDVLKRSRTRRGLRASQIADRLNNRHSVESISLELRDFLRDGLLERIGEGGLKDPYRYRYHSIGNGTGAEKVAEKSTPTAPIVDEPAAKTKLRLEGCVALKSENAVLLLLDEQNKLYAYGQGRTEEEALGAVLLALYKQKAISIVLEDEDLPLDFHRPNYG